MQLSKSEIAKGHIEAALSLYFNRGDHLAIITLAGAAEEVLGSLVRRSGELAMIDHLVNLVEKETGTRLPLQEVSAEVNFVRNALKHANTPDEDKVEIGDPDEKAVSMLARAVVNYAKFASDLTPQMWQFYEHLKALHPDVIT